MCLNSGYKFIRNGGSSFYIVSV